MSEILTSLALDCHQILMNQPGPEGRKKIAKLLYEHPDMGFCILAHNYNGAKTSPPHDHGPSWAIYAQARGATIMRDYDKIEAASNNKSGKVIVSRTYTLTPGIAHVYNEGDVHSPTRDGLSSLIRIEGTNMSKVKRSSYELV